MKQEQRIMIYSIVSGIVLGLLAKYIFSGSVYNLAIWAIAAVIIGYYSKTIKEAVLNGFLFGFFVSFFFMWHGYSGNALIITRTPFFAALGAFGGVSGLILSTIGNQLAEKINKK